MLCRYNIDPDVGVADEFGTYVILPVSRVPSLNEEMTQLQVSSRLYMNFDNCIFIGESGSGDLYFMRFIGNEIYGNDIYKWDHENDNRMWFANDVKDLMKRNSDH